MTFNLNAVSVLNTKNVSKNFQLTSCNNVSVILLYIALPMPQLNQKSKVFVKLLRFSTTIFIDQHASLIELLSFQFGVSWSSLHLCLLFCWGNNRQADIDSDCRCGRQAGET